MRGTRIRWAVRSGILAAMFAAGFLCGSVSQRPAQAGMEGMAGKVMEKAGDSGGPLGAAVKLGTSISDMQQHLDALNKNMETLRQIKGTLGG